MSNLYQYNGKEWKEIGKDGRDAVVDYDSLISRILAKIPVPTNGIDGSPDTGEQIIAKLNPLKNSLDFEVLTNIPDFALSRDVVGYHGGGGGGGGQQYRISLDGTYQAHVTSINFEGATYDGNGLVTVTGGGVSFGTVGQVPVMNATNDDFNYSASLTFSNGELAIKGTTNDGSTGIISFQDSDSTEVGSINTDGLLTIESIFANGDISGSFTGNLTGNADTATTLVNFTVTAQASTPLNLASTDTLKTYTNEGATAQIVFNLPTAVANLKFTFIVVDTDGIRVKANTGDTIRIDGVVSASAGYIEAFNIGTVVTLLAINDTQWICVSAVGSWLVV